MKFIYVKNYLNLPKKEKLNFYKYAGTFVNLKQNYQKIIFDENSLLIGVDEHKNIEETKKHIESFFEIIDDISVSIINNILETKDSLILSFDNKSVLKVKL